MLIRMLIVLVFGTVVLAACGDAEVVGEEDVPDWTGLDAKGRVRDYI